MSSRFVDLSHVVEHGMITYPGLPGPVITTHRERTEISPGVSFHIGRIELVANTGTYVDAPFHYDAGRRRRGRRCRWSGWSTCPRSGSPRTACR